MGIFENREYFEKLSKITQTQIDTNQQQRSVDPASHPLNNNNNNNKMTTNTDTSTAEDMSIDHQTGLKSVPHSARSNQNMIYQPTSSRPSVLKKSPASSSVHAHGYTNNNQPSSKHHRRFQIGMSVLAWALILQIAVMTALFDVTQPVSQVQEQQGKTLSVGQKVYIVCVLVLSACMHGWQFYSMWTRHPRFLLITLIANTLQLVAFIVVPVIYFNPATSYRQCFDARDCLRFTMPIGLYLLSDVIMLICFWLFAFKTIRQDPHRSIRFNLAA